MPETKEPESSQPKADKISWAFFLTVILSLVASTFASTFACYLAVLVFKDYGWTLFVFTPILHFFLAAVIYGMFDVKGFWRSYLVGIIALLVACLPILFFALEGLICLVMAFPLAAFLGVFGTLFGMLVIRLVKKNTNRLPILGFFVFLLPFLLGFEASRPTETIIHKTVTRVEINAPREKIWKLIVAFPEIKEPPGLIFRAGFSYPMNANVEGEGVGAIRSCNFNTGALVEPITAWDEPNLLAFDVQKQPALMTETSPYQNLHVPHLDFIRSHKGQFRLVEENGKTILEGTTWYSHQVAPEFYWNLYSDYVIHQIHLRVLNHIKKTAESE